MDGTTDNRQAQGNMVAPNAKPAGAMLNKSALIGIAIVVICIAGFALLLTGHIGNTIFSSGSTPATSNTMNLAPVPYINQSEAVSIVGSSGVYNETTYNTSAAVYSLLNKTLTFGRGPLYFTGNATEAWFVEDHVPTSQAGVSAYGITSYVFQSQNPQYLYSKARANLASTFGSNLTNSTINGMEYSYASARALQSVSVIGWKGNKFTEAVAISVPNLNVTRFVTLISDQLSNN